MSLDLDLALEVAIGAAKAGGQAALAYHRTPLQVQTKTDDSPVTLADQASERAIVGHIRSAFPTHSLLTEESGSLEGDPDFCWIVDPLDGTKGFIRGATFWGPLVALAHRGDIVAGTMYLPALPVCYWAALGRGAYRDGEKLQVSKVDTWSSATLSVGEMGPLMRSPHQAGILRLIDSADSTRCYGDGAGLAMVLDGLADAWVEGGVQTWDLAPSSILIREAGGRFSDFKGDVSLDSGCAIVSNGVLHASILQKLNDGHP